MDILFPKKNLIVGDLGYWDIKENVMKIALEFNTKSEFSKKYKGAYKSAIRNGWLDEVCSHMEVVYGKWNNIENLKEEAKKYSSRTEFYKACPGAYLVIRNNGWADEVFSDYIKYCPKWGSIDKVKEEALKYNSRSEFSKGSGSAYNVSLKNGWLDEVCSHMIPTQYPMGHWNEKKNVIDVISGCKNKTEFAKKYKGAYKSVIRNGWMDELFPKKKLILEEETI
jgi:hypothetical protein